ncbi:hypothetical protein E1286_26395 [Nonomuraea terrae]|uniref:Peptidyl-prolyl cis-trans isomerase n=1 Tax=Nonomuraea terrae TaxID=2530383 RepID=A0A4R4YIG0_9ACTN|nr:hypothetical protein [Nonomuraea terrae]TDD44691.1 hypothetical protein E1286_26395 [Nonomuraea terrae]
MPTDDHIHTPGSGSAAVIGWVDDRPIPRDRLDQRLDELRNGPLRSALPVPGTSEDRQLARWVTQVILTEALCEATATDLGLSPEQATEPDGSTPAQPSRRSTAPAQPAVPAWFAADQSVLDPIGDRDVPEPSVEARHVADRAVGGGVAEAPGPSVGETGVDGRVVSHRVVGEPVVYERSSLVGGSGASWRLDRVAAVELGSINAAAYHGNPWVRAVYHHVTASASVPPEWRRSTSSGRSLRSSGRSLRHLVRHRLFDDPAPARDATEADLESLGPVELDSLPSAIAEALDSHPYGTLVGPVVDALGWHVAMATPVHPAPASATLDGDDHDSSLVEAARRKAFARWLDDMRAKRVRLVPGFEHPGDPRQPDNHHKH